MKELKDGLKEIMTIGTKEYYSISEVLNADYNRFKESGEGYGIAEYRGKLISLDIEDSNEEDNSLHSNIANQISIINEELEGE